MNQDAKVFIHFILDNKLTFKKTLYHPPRIGDDVRFAEGVFKINAITWCYDEDLPFERMNCGIERI